jgi:hypothetical protein
MAGFGRVADNQKPLPLKNTAMEALRHSRISEKLRCDYASNRWLNSRMQIMLSKTDIIMTPRIGERAMRQGLLESKQIESETQI